MSSSRARRREQRLGKVASDESRRKGLPFVLAYAAIALLELAGEGLEIPHLVWVTKPLLMPVLAAWVFTEIRSRPTTATQALLVSLIFSLGGDAFLMFPETLFLWGLGSFLVGHLAYIVAFWAHPPGAPRPKELPRGAMMLTLPIHFYAAGMVAYLLPHLGDFRTPVLVYMAAIFAMALSATFRRGRVSDASFWPVYAGAIAFLISDSIIALHRFVEPVPYHRLFIMTTYVAAQYWITRGLLLQHREEALRPV